MSDRLDDATEQGIRERCGCVFCAPAGITGIMQDCTAPDQRAAILADREARQKAERDLADRHAEALRAIRDVPQDQTRTAVMTGDPARIIQAVTHALNVARDTAAAALRAHEEARRG